MYFIFESIETVLIETVISSVNSQFLIVNLLCCFSSQYNKLCINNNVNSQNREITFTTNIWEKDADVMSMINL